MKKFVTWLLVCLMVVSALPMAVFAESAEAVCPGKGQPHSASNCTSTLLTEVKATCEKSGYVLNACTTCATPFVVSTSEKLDCVEGTIEAQDGTCGTKEINGKNYCTTCSVKDCEHCLNEVIPAVTQAAVRDEHRDSWVLVSTYEDCTKGQTYYCPTCKESFSVRGAGYENHDWVLDRVTLDPTCTVKGKAVLVCASKGCAEEKIVDVAALGHDMDYTVPAIKGTPATCTEPGVKDIYGCSRCDRQLVIVGLNYVEVTDENKVIPPSHNYGQGAVSATNPKGWETVRNYVAGTCTTDETIEAYCKSCNKFYLETLTEAPGHNWGTGVAGTPVPCVGTYKDYTCTCGETKREWDTADKAMPTTKTHKFGTYAAASATGSGVTVSFNNFDCVTDKVATWTCACGETMTETVAPAPGHIVATQTVQSTNCMMPTYTFEYCNSGVNCGMHTYTDDVAKVIDGKLTFVGTWTDAEDATIKYVTSATPNYTTTHPQLVVQVGENVEFIRIVSVSVDDNGDFIFAENHNWTKTYNTADVIPGVTVAGLGQATCTAEGHYVNICVKHAIMEKDAGGNPLIGTDSVKPHNWTDAGKVSDGQAATCTVDGTKATYKCSGSGCDALAIKEGTTFVAKTDANVVIPKTNHNMVNLVVKTDALCNTAIATWNATNGTWVATKGYDYTIQVCTNAHCNETNSTIGGLKAVSYATGTTGPVIPATSDTLKYVDTAYATVTLGNKACGNIAVYGSIQKAAAEHAVPATAAGWTKMNANVILCEAPLIYTIECTGCGEDVMVEDASQVGTHVNDSDYTDAGEVAPESVNCGGDINTVPKYGKFACKFCGELFDNDPATANVTVNHNNKTIVQAETQFVSCDKDVWSKVGTLCLDCGKWDGEGDAAVKTYEGVGHDIVHHEAVPAQCGIDGVKAYDTCSRCDYTNVPEADRKIEALRHIPVLVNAISNTADCMTTAAKYSRCGLCDGKLPGGHKVVVTTLKAEAHDFTVPVTEEAGCVTDGKTSKKCANCDVIDTANAEVIPATGHTDATGKFFSDCDTGYTGGRTCTVCAIEIAVTHGDNVVENIVDATCTEDGSKYAYCGHCNTVTIEPTIIPANGEHDWILTLDGKTADAEGWFVTVEPTVDANGVKIRQCETCGHTETGVAAAPVQYSLVVDNHIVPGATIVENSIVAVTVVLNKTIASVWGFELDVNVPDGNNFEYLGVEDVNSNFTIQVADHGAKIGMFAYNVTGVENIAVESDVELVTLLFRVVAPRTSSVTDPETGVTTGPDALDYENAYEFSIDKDTILTLDADGEHLGNIVSDPAKVEIGKLFCKDDEDAFTIDYLRKAFMLIKDGEYASEFDIDLDGALTLSDISTIQALILVAEAQFDAEVAKLLKAAW